MKKQGKKENYKKYRNKILTRFQEMVKTETSFWQDFGKCWKQKREQKQGLLECHETMIWEQKQGIGAGLVPSDISLQESQVTNEADCLVSSV